MRRQRTLEAHEREVRLEYTDAIAPHLGVPDAALEERVEEAEACGELLRRSVREALREELVEHAAEVDRAAQADCQLAAEALVDFARGHTKSES